MGAQGAGSAAGSPESPGRGPSAWARIPASWRSFLPLFSSGHPRVRGLTPPRLGKRKTTGCWLLTWRTNFSLTPNGRKRCGWWRCWPGEGRERDKSRHQPWGRCPPQKAGGGQDPLLSSPLGSVPFVGLQCPLSRGRRIAAHRRPRSPRSARSLQQTGARAAPRQLSRPPLIASDSLGQQSRDRQRWFPGGDQSSVWSAFKQEGWTCAARTSGPGRALLWSLLAVFAPGKAKEDTKGRVFLSRRSCGLWGG